MEKTISHCSLLPHNRSRNLTILNISCRNLSFILRYVLNLCVFNNIFRVFWFSTWLRKQCKPQVAVIVGSFFAHCISILNALSPLSVVTSLVIKKRMQNFNQFLQWWDSKMKFSRLQIVSLIWLTSAVHMLGILVFFWFLLRRKSIYTQLSF